MSLPRRAYDPRRVCLLPLPTLPAFLRSNKRSLGIYVSGALFAVGWWFFLDVVMLSSIENRRARVGLPDVPGSEPTPVDPPPVSVSGADWLPGLCATLGMLVVNLIDKSNLGEVNGAFSFGGGGGGGGGGGFGGAEDVVQWRARLFLFIGFALLAGGLAGSFTVLTVKYLVASLPQGWEYYGIANVVQNSALMLSTVLLWVSQSAESEYEYNLQL